MVIIGHAIKRADIKVDSIYVDAALESYRSQNLLRYEAKVPKFSLQKAEKNSDPAPWEHALSLSYLNSKEIWIRAHAKAYVR